MIDKTDYVELGLACADVCKVLNQGINGRRVDQLGPSVLKAIERLTTQVEPAIQRRAIYLPTFRSQDCV